MKIKRIVHTSALPILLAFALCPLTACADMEIHTSEEAASADLKPAKAPLPEENTPDASARSHVEEIDPGYTSRDLSSDWDRDQAIEINLNLLESAGYPGVTVEGSVLTITASGVYVFTGSLSDGQIIVDILKEEKAQLVLNGVNIHCEQRPPIHVVQADKVFVTLAEGTQNFLSSGSDYLLEEGEDEPHAVLYSKEDLTIQGTGSLTVTAEYRHGIVSKDDLVITGGAITVTAVDDALRGKDSVAISGGVLTLYAGNDGIKSNNSAEGKGWVSIDGGTLLIQSASGDGIQAENTLQIRGGDITIETGSGSTEALNTRQPSSPSFGGWGMDAGSNTIQTTEETNSTKGLKAGTFLLINGGNIEINAEDDALHSNGSVTIDGGALLLSSGDDGVHADENLLIRGGSIRILESYEGLEGQTVTITGGDISLYAKDDGINAAGGESGGGFGRPGQNMENTPYLIQITGGTIYVNADGDGLDSNGNVVMSGGTVIIDGPTGRGDGAIDFDGSGEITGGRIAAAGSAGMAENFTTGTQPSLLIQYSAVQSAGTRVTLTDENGNVLLSLTPAKDYQTIVISAPELGLEQSYTLYSGGSLSTGSVTGFDLDGSLTGGSEVVTITLTDIITSMTDTGEALRSMGMGGMGGRGGNRDGGMGQRPGRGEEFSGDTPPNHGQPERPSGFAPPEGEARPGNPMASE